MGYQKSKGNILIGMILFILIGFIVYWACFSYEHLHTALGGESFDPVIAACDIMWALLIYSIVFSLAAIPILVITFTISTTWPIWMIIGLMFYTGELIWAIRLTLTNIGINI